MRPPEGRLRAGSPLARSIVALAGDDDPVASIAMVERFAAETHAREAVLGATRGELARFGLTGAPSRDARSPTR